jgi:hypothetical protein
MVLVKNEKKYYDFIRKLRTDPDNILGFLNREEITKEQQDIYMSEHENCYFICLVDNNPVGYVGVVEDDIRICTSPEFKQKGVGFFMLSEITKLFPKAKAKILKENTPSLNLFFKCNFKILDSDNKLYYLIKDV